MAAALCWVDYFFHVAMISNIQISTLWQYNSFDGKNDLEYSLVLTKCDDEPFLAS